MDKFISVIIPNYNGASTIGRCLEGALSSTYPRYEVIVVDDCSTDASVEIIRRFPCTLIMSDKHSGASLARNTGALHSKGEILFFTDADCVLATDTLSRAVLSIGGREDAVIGGTYTKLPCDRTFFSTFQSIFVNYSETRKAVPDYIATHAMTIARELFRKTGGFAGDFLPILEDVEFSHRLRRSGYALIMDPLILVSHIFHFTLLKSLRNAFRKSMFWTEYSLRNRDIFADSGTASRELKVNVVCFFVSLVLLLLFCLPDGLRFLLPIPLIASFNLFSSRGLIRAFFQARGVPFTIAAAIYYTMIYPVAVGAGASAGFWRSVRPGIRR